MLDDPSDCYLLEQQQRLQHSFLSAMCCVDWVDHEYHTQPLLPSPKKNQSPWAVNSASFPTEVRLMAMISISPLAILALETDSFALLGQLLFCVHLPRCFRSYQDLIWRTVQSGQVFQICNEVPKEERKGCLGESCLFLTYWAHIPCTLIWEHSLQTKQRITTCSCRFQIKEHCGYSNLFSILKVLLHAWDCLAFVIPSQAPDFKKNGMKIYLCLTVQFFHKSSRKRIATFWIASVTLQLAFHRQKKKKINKAA